LLGFIHRIASQVWAVLFTLIGVALLVPGPVFPSFSVTFNRKMPFFPVHFNKK